MDYIDFTLEASGDHRAREPQTPSLRGAGARRDGARGSRHNHRRAPELQRMLERLEDRDLTEDDLMRSGAAFHSDPADRQRAGKASIREMLARRLLIPDGKGVRLRLRFPSVLAGAALGIHVRRSGRRRRHGRLSRARPARGVRRDTCSARCPSPPSGDPRVVAALASAPDLRRLIGSATSRRPRSTARPARAGVPKMPRWMSVQAAIVGAEIFHSPATASSAARWATCRDLHRHRLARVRRSARWMPSSWRSTCAATACGWRCSGAAKPAGAMASTSGAGSRRRWSRSRSRPSSPTSADQRYLRDRLQQQFYGALAGGLPIEPAVAAGRIAAYNADKGPRLGRAGAVHARCRRPAVRGGRHRRREQAAAQADFVVRTASGSHKASSTGPKVREVLAGTLSISVTTGDVAGRVVGGEFEIVVGGGTVKNTTVNTGDVTGEVIRAV